MNNDALDKNRINIELDEAVAQGEYVNLAVISHSSSEFVIDAILLMPGVPKAKVKVRLIMTPENAKRLLSALGDNIGKFEDQFGDIKLHEGGNNHGIPLNFGGPVAQA